MKISLFLAALLVCAIGLSDSQRQLICHTWRKVGTKPFQKDFMASDPKEELLTLKMDGTYDELLYGSLQMKGVWTFNPDSTKLDFILNSMNGKSVAGFPTEKKYYNDSLVRLTEDTLIDAHLAYFGPEKVYGHDDWYFVRVDKK